MGKKGKKSASKSAKKLKDNDRVRKGSRSKSPIITKPIKKVKTEAKAPAKSTDDRRVSSSLRISQKIKASKKSGV